MPKICLLFFFFSLYIISCDTNNPTNSEESEESEETEETEEIKANASTIDLSTEKQIIRGFGAANIVGWRPDMTEQDIYQGIGTEEGQLGFSILRLRIPPQEDQFDQNVSTAEKAYSMGAKIVASPWSPPAEMKTNNDLVGGKLREDSYEEYAAHLAAFNDVMESNGAPLHAISTKTNRISK